MKTLRITHQADDVYLRRAFSWLTRIGASPKFGSRPIGWYQMHQCAALKRLEQSGAFGLPVRCKFGMIQAKPEQGKWFDVISVRDLYNYADSTARH